MTSQQWAEYVRKSQDSLRVIAEETGGIAVVNQNDFSKALKRIVGGGAVAGAAHERVMAGTAVNDEIVAVARIDRVRAGPVVDPDAGIGLQVERVGQR